MARRVSASVVDWAEMGQRVTAAQRTNFLAFKSKSDNYLRRVLANPAESPKINWTFYKANVPIAGMVDNFQKQYEALKIPYPVDNVSSQVDAQENVVKSDIAKFVTESNARISAYQTELAKLMSLLSYSDMTLEDFKDAHPELAIDPMNNPTFWPHTPDEQLDYVEKDAQPAESH